MNTFSILLRVSSANHTFGAIKKALGVAPDSDSQARQCWQLTPKSGQGFPRRMRALMKMLPEDFADRLMSLKGARGVVSIALSSADSIASLHISRSVLSAIVGRGLAIEVVVITPLIEPKSRHFAA